MAWKLAVRRILLVDDDVRLCSLLTERLSGEECAVEAVHDGVQGLDRARSQDYSLVILDLMLPGMPGLEVLRRLRATSDIPVIILTARGEEVERILGLEVGADDYLAKPFSPRELIARIRAILRRTDRGAGAARLPAVAGITINSAAREAWQNDTKLHLTSAEFSLLEVFVSHAGRVISREQLTQAVLGREPGPFDRVIDVHVSNLRKKLGPVDAGERIKAVRGSGYLFVIRPEPS